MTLKKNILIEHNTNIEACIIIFDLFLFSLNWKVIAIWQNELLEALLTQTIYLKRWKDG